MPSAAARRIGGVLAWPAVTASDRRLRTGPVIRTAERRDGRADPFRRRLDVLVGNVRVPQGHRNLAVTKQPRHRRQRYALHDGIAGEIVSQVMEAHILESGTRPNEVPDGRRP